MILAHQTTAFGPLQLPNTDGFKISFAVACGAALPVGLPITPLFLPNRRRTPLITQPAAAEADRETGSAGPAGAVRAARGRRGGRQGR